MTVSPTATAMTTTPPAVHGEGGQRIGVDGLRPRLARRGAPASGSPGSASGPASEGAGGIRVPAVPRAGRHAVHAIDHLAPLVAGERQDPRHLQHAHPLDEQDEQREAGAGAGSRRTRR
ncbi:MAG: hypothetical protein MZV64_05035 [Ignavibacteriales bacterium]|nr:hypothetical protein [Ignavibacteriales bacterium]